MAKSTQILTMNRNGEFRIYAYGPNHCGVANDIKVTYHMVCECDTRLDKRGFLFDQVCIDNYFQGIKRTKLSCERLAIRSLKDLRLQIVRENPLCVIRSLQLTLSPEPFKASMTHTWQNGSVEAR